MLSEADNAGWADAPDITEAVRTDFMRNSNRFAVNKIHRATFGNSEQMRRCAFSAQVPVAANWYEVERRGRMLAQQAMSFRTARIRDALLEKSESITWPNVPVMPESGGQAFLVMSPDTAMKVSLGDLYPAFRATKWPGIVIEESVQVTGNGGSPGYMIPDGIVFLVWRADEWPVGTVPKGLSIMNHHEAFLAQTNEGAVRIIDKLEINVNGLCYQFKV